MNTVKINIEQRLAEELRIRNSKLLIPHVILLFLSSLVFKKMHSEVAGQFLPYFLILTSLLFRFVGLKYFSRQFFLYLGFVALTGVGWGLLFWQVYSYFTLFSIESLYCLGVILTLMAGGVTAFSASIKTTAVYLIFLSCIPVAILWQHPTSSSYILAVLFLGNTIYQFYHAYISNRFLKDALRNEYVALNQKETLQQFIDSIPGLVTLIDKNETYVMVNNYMDGFFRASFLGKTIGSIYPQTNIPRILKDFIASSVESSVHEIQFSELGVDNWYVLNLKKITSPEQGVLVAILPITELVKAKNDLKIQEARSQYAAKLASLGEFSASIAHEVNNPLTIIEGAASLIKMIIREKPLDLEALDKTSGKVMETTQRIGRIIKSLKMLSGDADGEPYKNVSFAAIVEPSLEISKARLKEFSIKLKVNAGESDVYLFGNEVQLSQVMMNLVANAIDAVKDCEGERWIEINFHPTIEWLDILVVDSGPGVREEIRARIMEPFFTTKDSHHGTGLGLSISNSIVHTHHGILEYLPAAAHTTFRMRLPRMSPLTTRKSDLVEDTGVVQG